MDIPHFHIEVEVRSIHFYDGIGWAEACELIADKRALLRSYLVLSAQELEDGIESMVAHVHDHAGEFLLIIKDVQDACEIFNLIDRAILLENVSAGVSGFTEVLDLP